MTTARLKAKADEILIYAEAHGWEVASEYTTQIDGCIDAVLLGGVIECRHPDAVEGVEFMFTIGFGVNERTGRVVVLGHADRKDAPFVIEVEAAGRYWYGPMRSWKTALADVLGWTGYPLPGPES